VSKIQTGGTLDWIHRFPDTYVSNQLELHCKNMAENWGLCQRVGHADPKMQTKYFDKLKPAYEPKFPERLKKAKNAKYNAA
jgi:hypothetical protein